MTTHLGRVVYDRKKNPFKRKDIARILYSELYDKEPNFAGLVLAELLIRVVVRWAKEPGNVTDFIGGFAKGMAGYVAIVPDPEGFEKQPERLF